MARLPTVPTTLKSLGTVLLRLRASKLLDPIASRLLPAIYFAKYARWFHDQGIASVLLPTRQAFGYENRYALYTALSEELGLADSQLLYLEFGVATGVSLKWWVEHNRHPESRFVGFDTFEGLPENWGRIPAGTFATDGRLPDIDDPRCSLERGLFQQTLPSFLRRGPLPSCRTLVHLDADLYSSTLFVLVTLGPLLKPGDVLIFDEFADGMNEFRALMDASSCLSLCLRPLGAVNWGNKVALLVTSSAGEA
jgi:hypothetical protein